jgi:hypothetical protein
MRKIRGTAVSGRVKRDYLIELAAQWYRIDTIKAPFSRPYARSRVASPA